LSRLRIAFVGQRGVPAREGGIERHVEEIGSRLADRGHEVTVYCRHSYVGEGHTFYRGMRLRRLPTIRTKHLDFIVHSFLSTLAAISARPDIIHYHAIGSGLVAPLPRALSRCHIVLTVHGLDYERDKWMAPARAALKLGASLSAWVPHATITVSRELTAHYATKFGEDTDYIPNGVPEPAARDLGEIGKRLGISPLKYFLFVGRLVPEKNPALLVRAFRRVPGDAKLVLAGSSGFSDDYVAALAAAAAADPRTILAGGVFGEDLEALYCNAAAFVLPSSLEGLPMTLLEAAAYGAPVIVSDIAGHREIIEVDGPGHRFVPVGDEEALTVAMMATLAAPEEAASGASELQSRVRSRYSWDAAAIATERVYMRLCGTRAARQSTLSTKAGNPSWGKRTNGQE
jgi:glycosyltransferase involved in cell wall biosynthesis